MIKEAIILAGGFGTRLKHLLGNVPKPMAPVCGRPFLCYLIDKLQQSGVERIVLATGYLHEQIENYFGGNYKGVELIYSVESQPLFTGGAIKKAAGKIKGNNFLVLNGDTLFDVDYQDFSQFHEANGAVVSLALREVDDTSRYGAVELSRGVVSSFAEKADSVGSGLINGGVYAIDKTLFFSLVEQQQLPEAFSFENHFLQVQVSKGVLAGKRFDNYFIDIGVPHDYRTAQVDFRAYAADKYAFLDRDGVLNKQIIGDYVRQYSQFEFLPHVLDALAVMKSHFDRIIIVSNQQGVGKGLFTKDDLSEIDRLMCESISSAGGRIDKSYYCTDLESANSSMRKPQIGMALKAKSDFPEIDFHQALMIGDSLSDMQFGYKAQMRCVYLTKNNLVPDEIRDYTDLIYTDLQSFISAYIPS